MLYLITLACLVVAFIAIVAIMKYMRRVWLWNIVYASIVFLLYLGLVIHVYLRSGPSDWNFLNTLPTANVSPFMFCSVIFVFILPKSIKKYLLLLYSLLSVGMILSASIGCINYYSINYKFHPHFLMDFVPHFALATWGVYIVKSKQVELNIKNSIVSGAIIVVVAMIMLILNVILDTAFFGLSLNGKHNIYNMVLVENSYVSALIYFVGLILVLGIGFGFNKLLNLKRRKRV